MVNRENMEKWIEALESGKHEQVRCAIKTTDGAMCAMGVGVHVALENGMKGNWEDIRWFEMSKFYGIGVRYGINVSLKPDDSGSLNVVSANDHHGQDFWTIAQRLRETYLKDES